MLVKISIIKPLRDRFTLRCFTYITIKTINVKRQTMPSKILSGYSIGCFAITPNETIVTHKKAQTSPNAPTADKPNDNALVFILQLFLIVFENIKQNKPEIISVTPKTSEQKVRPVIKLKVIYEAVGPSAPPIIPIAPFWDV